jgi:hypothetical protein
MGVQVINQIMPTHKKHHFVPRFYFDRWKGVDQKITYYSWLNDQLHIGRVSPKFATVEEGLYSLANVSEEETQSIEREFLAKRVDETGARVMRKLLHNSTSKLSQEDRVDWTRFLVSLRVRTPEMVRSIREDGPKIFRTALNERPSEYLDIKNAADPETLEKWVEKNFGSLIDNAGMIHFPAFVEMEKPISVISNMFWEIIDFSHSSVELITCDRPCLLKGSLDDQNTVLVLPISPKRAFFATHTKELMERLKSEPISLLARALNDNMVHSAVKYVYARDGSLAQFVERRLRKA